MFTVVVYDTKFGNTAKIAEAIARGAGGRGDVRVLDAAAAAEPMLEPPDLLIVGGPTQRRGASPVLRSFLDALPPSLRGVPVATFDTRYRGAAWLMGTAAGEAAKRLERTGSRLSAPPESFFITRGGPPETQRLEGGELERAEAWGRSVATAAPDRR
jgi:flavodoxin